MHALFGQRADSLHYVSTLSQQALCGDEVLGLISHAQTLAHYAAVVGIVVA